MTVRSALLLAAVCIAGAAPSRPYPPLKSGPPAGARNNRRGFSPRWVAGFCAGQHCCPV